MTLISHWKFATNGDLSDETGTHDAISTTAEWIAGGKYDGALDYELADLEFTQLGQDLFETQNVGSTSLWIKIESNAALSFFSSSVATNNFNMLSYQIYNPVGSDLYILLQHYTAEVGANYVVYGDTKLSLGVWYHVVITQNASAFKIYINAELENLTPLAEGNTGKYFNDLPAGTHDVRLGKRQRSTGTQYFDGIIDDVRVYDTELSQADVTALYNLTYGITILRRRIEGD